MTFQLVARKVSDDRSFPGSYPREVKNILIVDDESDLRAVLKDFLESELKDVKVFEASNGAEGFHKIQNMRFDLVVTDMQMPKVSGQVLLRDIATLEPNQRPPHIIVLTAYGKPNDIPTKVGHVLYIAKPPKMDAFADTVAQLIGLKKIEASSPSNPGTKFDANFINPFIDSTLRVLDIAAGITAKKEKVFVRQGDQISGDISAVMALQTESFIGSLAVSFEEKSFLAVVQGMLGEKFESITDEIQDACAEILNQIYGAAKVVLNEKGYKLTPAIPSVIVGKGHRVKHAINGPCIAVRFSTLYGTVQVEAAAQAR